MAGSQSQEDTSPSGFNSPSPQHPIAVPDPTTTSGSHDPSPQHSFAMPDPNNSSGINNPSPQLSIAIPDPSTSQAGNDSRDQHMQQQITYDPTGEYANAYYRRAGAADSQQQDHRGGFDTPTHLRRASIHHGSAPESQYRGDGPFQHMRGPPPHTFYPNNRSEGQYRGQSQDHRVFEEQTDDGEFSPLRQPVVRGRIVQQSRRQPYYAPDPEDHNNQNRGTSQVFRQDLVPYAPTSAIAPGRAPQGMQFRSNTRGYRPPQVDDDDYDDMEDDPYSDQGLFVPQGGPSHSNPYRVAKNDHMAAHVAPGPRPRTGGDYGRGPMPRHHAPEAENEFHNFGKHLEPSRYSGTAMPWGVQAYPKMVDQEEVSDASLLKRKLKRGNGRKVCKRGYGANDPENIAIVNMKEKDGLSFDQIAKVLNERRVQEGRNPSLSTCGVNSRFNRTAPLLCASQGQEFVPLSLRKSRLIEERVAYARDITWNSELDTSLVESVQDVDASRWVAVAKAFEEKTGNKISSEAAATRYNLL